MRSRVVGDADHQAQCVGDCDLRPDPALKDPGARGPVDRQEAQCLVQSQQACFDLAERFHQHPDLVETGRCRNPVTIDGGTCASFQVNHSD